MRRIFSMILATALMCSIMVTGASAGEKTKTIKLKSGDSMTISGYVEETREEIVIHGEKQTITCFSMDDSTEITFVANKSGTFAGVHNYYKVGNGYNQGTLFYMGDSQNPWRTIKMEGLLEYSTIYEEVAQYALIFLGDIDSKREGVAGLGDSISIYFKMADANTPVSAGANTSVFTDIASGAYYADAVKWAVDKGITAGTSATTFSPDATCTDAQILTFLWRASGQPEPTVYSELKIDEEGLGTVKVNGELGYVGPDSPLLNADIMAGVDTSGSFYLNPFKDVKASDYYYKAALWAYDTGMVSGNVFNAATPCTRSQTVMYLWKLAGSPDQAPIAGLTDVSSSAEYAVAVAWAVEQGITGGTSATTFAPDGICTRGQIVTFLYRDMGK